ncbi:MAG: integron integrase, partial [Actinomycetia bacterium]|nr:integron integrase [Actinomycetes bacterium]
MPQICWSRDAQQEVGLSFDALQTVERLYRITVVDTMFPSYQGPTVLHTPGLSAEQTRPVYSVQPLRLLDQLRAVIRLKHYSIRTEDAYVFWVRRYVRFCGLRHPSECGAAEVTSFLTYLANAEH